MIEFKVGHYYIDCLDNIFKVLTKKLIPPSSLYYKHHSYFYEVRFLQTNNTHEILPIKGDKEISKEEVILELL